MSKRKVVQCNMARSGKCKATDLDCEHQRYHYSEGDRCELLCKCLDGLKSKCVEMEQYRKALKCLYLEVDPRIAKDVASKVEEKIQSLQKELEAVKADNTKLKDAVDQLLGTDGRCPICNSDIGHYVNCPAGIATSELLKGGKS